MKFILFFLLLAPGTLCAQTRIHPCYSPSGTPTSCQDVGIDTPLPVTQVAPAARSGYRVATVSYAGYASMTDMACIYGSATRTVRVWFVNIGGHANATNQLDVLAIKRSTANSGGTPTTIAGTPMDSNFPAATATYTQYASAPSTGTAVGNVAAVQVSLNASGGSGPSQSTMDFTARARPIVLRGTSQGLCFNANGTSAPNGMALSADLEWSEE